MAKLTPNAIREKMGEIHAEAVALTNLAEKESRDLSADEKTQFDGLMASYNNLREKDLPRAEWLEAEEARLVEAAANARQPRGPESPDAIVSEDGIRAAAVRVPARVRASGGRLKHFHGDYAIEEAYIAGNWFLGAVLGRDANRTWCLDHGIEIRGAMSTTENSKGGFLVPEEFSSAIIRLVEEYGVFRRKARVWPMASDHTMIPRRLSGVTTYFVGENTEITPSDMLLDQVTLTARKLAALTKWSTEIDEDSVLQIADLLAWEIAYAFAVKEDACGFLGTGALATYGGISGLITACAAATATVVTALTGNTSFGTLDLVDFEAMIGKLPEFPGIRPEWYISKSGWAASMMRLADAAGGNTADIIEGRRQLTFLGYPVNIVQTMNKTLTTQTSTSGLCYFGDLSMAATMGTRRELTLSTTTDRYFELDQLAIKGTERFDIVVHDVGTTSVAGAMVMLSTPAS
jgi:HK97 family phage major capsid protein